MASLCDDIARFICDALKETQQIDLQRNLLAERFRCAPSQITYVLSTRFTPQNGCRPWSHGEAAADMCASSAWTRCGISCCSAPFIRLATGWMLPHLHELLRDLTAAERHLSGLQARLMRTCLDESVLGEDEEADRLRAKLFCRMLTCVLEEG